MTVALGIFQGGGAMGVAHIGAIRAAEEENYEFAGVAGASAGALVAALLAVGYDSHEIFDPTAPNQNLLAKFDAHPLALLGDDSWRRFEKAIDEAEKYFTKSLFVGTILSGCAWPTPHRVLKRVFTHLGYFE